MLELTPSDPIVKTYLKDLHDLKQHAITKRGWHLVPELATHYGGKRVVPDGTVRDEFCLARGWWEAKDTSDNLAKEIEKKLKAGYPARNTIFKDVEYESLPPWSLEEI
jgi:hypothetical protein